MGFVANARMYAVAPGAAAAWRALFRWLGHETGLALEIVEHAYPASLDALWQRSDLACVFMCGLPFAREGAVRPLLAAPVPLAEGAPRYRSHFVVRRDAPFAALEDSFGLRFGWTVEDSQSGFSAPRHHLLRYRSAARPLLYGSSTGGFTTPRRVVEAVRDGSIDVGPVDGYAWELLVRHAPELTADVRVLASTEPAPIPPLVAAAGAPADAVGLLSKALVRVGSVAALAELRDALRIEGFVRPDPAAYLGLLDRVEDALRTGYPRPA